MAEHYFATCALGWATDKTHDGAIGKLVRRFSSDFKEVIKNQQKQGTGFGMYVWTCKVLAPDDEPYKIEFYQPQGVETADHKEAIVYRVTAGLCDYALGNPDTKRIST